MSAMIIPSPLLRAALAVDSAASGIMGLGLTFGAGPLAGLLGLPQPLLVGAGVACLGWGAITGWLARRGTLSRNVVRAVIAINAIWVIESLLLLLSGWTSPSNLGVAFVLLQAIAVAAFAEGQLIGLKRAAPTGLATA